MAFDSETERNVDVVFDDNCTGLFNESTTIYIVNQDPFISRCFLKGTPIELDILDRLPVIHSSTHHV